MDPKNRDTALAALKDALGALRRLNLHDPGKGHHRCDLCRDDVLMLGKCPVAQALRHIYDAHSIAFGTPPPSPPGGDE